MKPRKYQEEAYNKIRDSFRKGNKHICLLMSGGAGKSLLAKMILDSASVKNKKIGFFSFRKSLTEQIKKYNIPNCDVGTLQKYGKEKSEHYDLVIFDEKDYHDTKLKNNINCDYSITLSGFPTDSNGYVLDYDDIVEAIQFPELVKQGFAKKVKLLSISNADTSSLKKVAGDFNKKESKELMEKPTIKKNIIDVYKKFCIGRKTLLFAIDTKHAENLKKEFIENGISCETIHSKKNSDDILEKFEDGEFDLLINVAMITIGVDIPCVNTILFARPMCSVPLFMQCVWRGTRKYKNDYCLVLDCAEVVKRCNFHPMQKLDINRKKTDKKPTKCICGLDMNLISKITMPVDEYEYKVISKYECTCGEVKTIENNKLINIELCPNCNSHFENRNGLSFKKNDKNITFNMVCGSCGFEKKFREVLLSDSELKEIKENEIMQGESWERVSLELTNECKKWGYKWQYRDRLLAHCKDKKWSIRESLNKIYQLKKQNKKISMLMYIN